jgi:predicted dehydrogenase
VIDQIRFALGDFAGVSASLAHLAERGMTADDAFVVHFRLRSGLVGTLQSTSGDWGPWLVATRVCGPRGSVWIDGLGDAVFVADRGGTRTVPVIEDLRSGPPDPVPADVFRSAYERMIGQHGLDLAPYTHLARVFRDRILGRALPAWARPATFADGVAQMEVLDAIRASAARAGEWIAVRS